MTQSPAQAHTGPAEVGAEPQGPPAGVEGPCPTHLLQLVPQAVFCDTQGPHASRPTRRLQLLDVEAVHALLRDQLSKEEAGDLQRAHTPREGLCCLHTHTSLSVIRTFPTHSAKHEVNTPPHTRGASSEFAGTRPSDRGRDLRVKGQDPPRMQAFHQAQAPRCLNPTVLPSPTRPASSVFPGRERKDGTGVTALKMPPDPPCAA